MASELTLKPSQWRFIHIPRESLKLSTNFHFQTQLTACSPSMALPWFEECWWSTQSRTEVSLWRTAGLISHNALSWWDSEEWPAANMSIWAQETRMCAGCFFLFYLIPIFLKMMALVTFSLPACQLDMAISTPSTPRPSWSVSFISKHHFTHGWL